MDAVVTDDDLEFDRGGRLAGLGPSEDDVSLDLDVAAAWYSLVPGDVLGDGEGLVGGEGKRELDSRTGDLVTLTAPSGSPLKSIVVREVGAVVHRGRIVGIVWFLGGRVFVW